MKATIFITQNCNFNCDYCLNRCPYDEEMSISRYKDILDSFGTELESVFFTGGEPILHSKFKKLVDETIKRDLNLSLVSNAYLYKKYSFLLEYDNYFTEIYFSVNGLRENHDIKRGKDSFDRVLEAIKFYKDKSINVTINFTVMPNNIKNIEKILKILSDQGIKTIRFGAVISNGINNHLKLNDKQRKDIYWNMSGWAKKFDLDLKCSPSLYSTGGVEFCSVFGNKNHIYINQKGEQIYCCNIKEPYGRVGDIDKDNLKKLSEKRDWITKKVRDDRMIKMVKGKMSVEQERNCEYCNLFFKTI